MSTTPHSQITPTLTPTLAPTLRDASRRLDRLRFPFEPAAFDPHRPRLFILGLPRTGTTLVYQYLAHRLDAAHFTRAVGDWPDAPCVATAMQLRRHGRYRLDSPLDAINRFGRVDAPNGPREAGDLWARFFGYHDYTTESLNTDDTRELHRVVTGIESIFGGAPFINKNIKHLLRIPALHVALPGAVFLRIRRPARDVALSLLRARRELLDDPTQWWSARPPAPEFQQLRELSLPEQIVGQIQSLDRRLTSDLAALPDRCVIQADYRAFCDAPNTLAISLASRLKTATRNNPLSRFRASTSRPTDELEAAVYESFTPDCIA